MDERDRSRLSPEIFVYATNKNFLNVYDALRIDKIKMEVAGYDQASGKQTGLAGAWLDVDDMRLLAHLIVTRQFKDVLVKGRFEKFGGSERDGVIESRTLVVEWDPGENGRFANYPYRLTIANGPGMRTPTGAVQPKGEPTNKQSMRLPEADLMKIMLAVQSYIQAYEAAHHHRLVATKLRELQEKMAERNGHNTGNGNGAPRPVAPAPAAPNGNGNGTGPLHVVRPAAIPAPTPPRQAPAPTPARPAPATPAPRPAASVAPVDSARPAPARPQPQVVGNAALAMEPELDMDAPAPRTSLRPVEAPRTQPEASRPAPQARSGPARAGTPAPAPTTASRPANSPARPFRSSPQG